jgi:hypothetical protein
LICSIDLALNSTAAILTMINDVLNLLSLGLILYVRT